MRSKIIISHRGLTNGPDDLENHPDLVTCTLQHYEVEIDLWVVNRIPWLGHSSPCYQTDIALLALPGIWAHCKNSAAIELCEQLGIHWFWHQDDQYAQTSQGLVIVHPTAPFVFGGVAMLPELSKWTHDDLESSAAICTDYAGRYACY